MKIVHVSVNSFFTDGFTYHKDNVGANINSDVIATTIEQDGKSKNDCHIRHILYLPL